MREAQHPLCAATLPPQPVALAHLRQRRVQAANKHSQWPDSKHQIMDYRYETQTHWLIPETQQKFDNENA